MGGGFTFLNSILAGLEFAPGDHRWTLIGNSPLRSEEFAYRNVEYLSVYRPPAEKRLDALRDAADRLGHQVRHIKELEQKPRQRQYLDRMLKAHGIDLIWSLTPEPVSTELPFISTVWDLQHRLQPWFPEISADREWRDREEVFWNVLPRATAVIVGTERGRQEVHDFYNVPRERISVVPFPTPALPKTDPSSDSAILSRYGLHTNYLFFPAQFVSHKNHVNLLHALDLIHKRGRTLTLVCSGGDGDNKAHVLDTIRKLGLADSVKILGFVPADHLPALYRGAACLAFPSFFGPDNLPPLEAMDHGCPVVAADVPGAAEQLGDAAVLFDPGSPQAMADAIVGVVDNAEKRQRLREAGRLRSEALTPESYVKSVSGLITQFESRRRCWPRSV